MFFFICILFFLFSFLSSTSMLSKEVVDGSINHNVTATLSDNHSSDIRNNLTLASSLFKRKMFFN